MKRYILFLLLFFALISPMFGQGTLVINQHKLEYYPSLGFVGGVKGVKTSELELGIGYNSWETRYTNKILVKPFFGGSLSASYFPSNKDLLGLNASCWVGSGVVLGVTQHLYQQFDNKTWGLEPFVGFELYGITLTYGYNIFLNKNAIEGISHHYFSLRYFLPVLKFKNKR